MPDTASRSRAKPGQRSWLWRLRRRRAVSPGSASHAAASIPAAAQLAPRPAAPRSQMVTAQPEAARRQPMARPIAPPPMMAIRGAAREDERMVAVNSGSLRWHYPDRFDGYDLSRSTNGPAPQP